MNKLQETILKIMEKQGKYYEFVNEQNQATKRFIKLTNEMKIVTRSDQYIIIYIRGERALEFKPNFSYFYAFDTKLVNEMIENELYSWKGNQ